jgi:DNA-binding GntR family transcriptional regulator
MSPTFRKIEPVSKKVRILNQLREAIISGVVESGEPVVELKLAEQFGVGQGLVREALIELEHEGFLERTPYSGTRVSMLTFEDVKQIFAIRIEIEPLVFFLAAQNATSSDIAELNELFLRTKSAFESKDIEAFFGSHLSFRKKIWQMSGNRYLQQALERLVIPLYALYLIRSTFNRESFGSCVDLQEKTLAAFRRGDAEEPRFEARAFLVRMIEHLAKRLTPESKDK